MRVLIGEEGNFEVVRLVRRMGAYPWFEMGFGSLFRLCPVTGIIYLFCALKQTSFEQY
jgi:hypothetical protein